MEQRLPAAIEWRTLVVREVVVTVVVATHSCHGAAPLKQKQTHLQFYATDCEYVRKCCGFSRTFLFIYLLF